MPNLEDSINELESLLLRVSFSIEEAKSAVPANRKRIAGELRQAVKLVTGIRYLALSPSSDEFYSQTSDKEQRIQDIEMIQERTLERLDKIEAILMPHLSKREPNR